MTSFPSHLLWVKARRQSRVWRREKRGVRLERMVRAAGNRGNAILTCNGEKLFICIVSLSVFNCCGVVGCMCTQDKRYAYTQPIQRHNKRFKWAIILGFTIETNMMWFQSQGSWKYLVKNVKYFCSFGNSKRPVKVWWVLKSVSLPEVQQRVFCRRHHNTKLIRRHAPGISVDLKGEGLGDFRVALSQPLKAISKWP